MTLWAHQGDHCGFLPGDEVRNKGPGQKCRCHLATWLPSNATRATLPSPPLPPRKKQARKVTSVQHDVVNHVAFVFGVIEAERTAKIFGALLGDR